MSGGLAGTFTSDRPEDIPIEVWEAANKKHGPLDRTPLEDTAYFGSMMSLSRKQMESVVRTIRISRARAIMAGVVPPIVVDRFDFELWLKDQGEWSERTFGPGPRTMGVIDHITKELVEIAQAPTDLKEWLDVVTLALDGARRAGYSPEQIVAGLIENQRKNFGRKWPDWRTADPDKAIEHVRDPKTPEWIAEAMAAGQLVEVEPGHWVKPGHSYEASDGSTRVA